ncbi:hypothetical protein KKP97_01630 [Methanothermococcus sp. SCGC AD-155-C09]|nr:hypothetical protein [Methanothermococcus sp. SCGC AD-155-C09]
MLKRWDTRNYDIKLILEVFDWINVPFESIGIPKPKVHNIKVIIKALIIKELEKLSLRSAEIRVNQILRVGIIILSYTSGRKNYLLIWKK